MAKDAQKWLDGIMRECAPDKMSKSEALDFLSEIHSAIDSAIDALETEIEEEVY